MELVSRSTKKQLTVAITTAVIISITGCTASMQKSWDDNAGKTIGVITGAAIGAILCNKKNRLKCAVIGALGGLTLGALWDQRQQELEALAKKQNIAIKIKKVKTFNETTQTGIEASINSGEMFKVSSARLTPKAKRQFEAIAKIYKNSPQKILVIGHTDATGSDRLNLKLSEKRAKTVARILASQGVPKSAIYFQGAGEAQPIATNDTMSGRSTNRRVEIIEVDSVKSIAAYSLQRSTDTRFIGNSTKTKKEKSAIKQQMQIASNQSVLNNTTGTSSDIQDKRGATQSQTVMRAEAKVDFAGSPAKQNIAVFTKALGSQVDDSFSLFSTAHASELYTPCFIDAPRIVGNVQSLENNKKLKPEEILKEELSQRDYWPGLNGNVWSDVVNDNLVAFKDLRVLKSSGGIVGKPKALVYTNYSKGVKKSDYKMPAHVATYKGTEGLLVRSYFKKDSPIQCMDFVFANNSVKQSRVGRLYYQTANGIYEQNIKLHRVK